MLIKREKCVRLIFSDGKYIYLSWQQERELSDYYKEILTPVIRAEAKKDYAPQMGHIALAAAIGFSRKRYVEAGEMSKIDPSDIKKEVPVDDDDEDFLDTVINDEECSEEQEYSSDEDDAFWDNDDWVTDPEEGDR